MGTKIQMASTGFEAMSYEATQLGAGQIVEFICSRYSLFITHYKIIRIVGALSLVNSCVYMRVWKHSCDIKRILIGYVLSG